MKQQTGTMSWNGSRISPYLMGAEKWRYADSLDEITSHYIPLYLHSTGNPTDVFHSGSLLETPSPESEPDHYVYDPRDIGLAGPIQWKPDDPS